MVYAEATMSFKAASLFMCLTVGLREAKDTCVYVYFPFIKHFLLVVRNGGFHDLNEAMMRKRGWKFVC